MPLCTDYLAKLPAPILPPNFPVSFAEEDVLRTWFRRMQREALNKTAAHDFEAYRHGWSEKPRHPFICGGPGAFRDYDLGGGHKVNLSLFLLEQRTDGRFYPFDWSQSHRDHKILLFLLGIFGFTSDKELLSFLLSMFSNDVFHMFPENLDLSQCSTSMSKEHELSMKFYYLKTDSCLN